jgi:hypothetical protein
MPQQTRKVKLNTRELAFWESLYDCGEEPKRYLKRGDEIEVLASATLYGGPHGDKEYYKVKHHVYGLGYMLKEGVDQDA